MSLVENFVEKLETQNGIFYHGELKLGKTKDQINTTEQVESLARAMYKVDKLYTIVKDNVLYIRIKTK
jgi:hypothetical protein